MAGVPGKPRTYPQPLRRGAALIAMAGLGNMAIDLWLLRGHEERFAARAERPLIVAKAVSGSRPSLM